MNDGPWYHRGTRDWCVYIDGTLWVDADGYDRHFVTADDARNAAEAEVFGPRRAHGTRPCIACDSPTSCVWTDDAWCCTRCGASWRDDSDGAQ